MPKYSNPPMPSRSPIRTTPQRALTHEGGVGWARDPKSELFVLAVTEMAEDTFYETAPRRAARMKTLVATVAKDDPAWLGALISWLRNKAHMRSASIMLAAEFAFSGAEGTRPFISVACQRPDEPAEMLGYCLATRGRKLPASIKRGIADAAVRLYNERAALKYDGLSRGVRMADVIELTHPKPQAPWQSALFRHLIDRRHDRGDTPPEILSTMTQDRALIALPVDERRQALEQVVNLGWSWERLAGWLPGGMDAQAWEAMIPRMGYMALLRNLRNFDEAGLVSMRQGIIERLTDPEAVANSKQFPYRFWNAYKNAPNLEWAPALEQALELSCQNIPELPGSSLILIDVSGSMQAPIGGSRSTTQRYEAAALFAAALAKKTKTSDVVIFAQLSQSFHPMRTESVLRYVDRVHNAIGCVGYATYVHDAIAQHYNGQDRVIVLTDEQGHDNYTRLPIPHMHVINLAGYKTAMMPSEKGRYTYAGFTDAMFSLMPLLEAGQEGRWPWA